MADFRINVIVDPRRAGTGINRIKRDLDGLETKGSQVGKVLRRALAFVGIAAGIREIVRLSDAFTNAQNRIRLVTRDTAQLNAVTAELFQIAKNTRVGFEATAKIYSRTALATKNLGLTQRETLEFTESLNQAVILSGASAQEANAGLIQLSQGLASGTLRGDELRSVLEQLPKVADVIAVQMRSTRGELRLLGEQGKISAKNIIDAFATAADSLEADFASTVPTIGQAFQVLRTGLIEFIGNVNESTGASETLARSLIFLSENLETIAKLAVVAGTALLVGFAQRGVLAATNAVRTLTLAIAANPLGALVIGVTAAVTALIQFSDQIKITADGAATLDDLFTVAFDSIKETFFTALDALKSFGELLFDVFGLDFLAPAFSGLKEFVSEFEFSIGGILTFAGKVVDGLINTFTGAFNAIIAVFSGFPSALGNLFIEATNTSVASIEKLVNSAIDGINKVNKFTGLAFLFDPIEPFVAERDIAIQFSDLGQVAADAFASGGTTGFSDAVASFLADVEAQAQSRLADIAPTPDAGLDVRPEPDTTAPFALRDQIRILEDETKLLQLSNRERDIQNKLLDIEKKLRTTSVILTADQRAAVENLIRSNQALREQADVLESIQGPQNELIIRQEALNALYVQGAIDLATFNEQMFQLTMAQSELNIAEGQGTFIDGFLLGIEDMLESVRNFGAEAGSVFADFFSQTTEGFSEAIAGAIVFGESIKENLGNVARKAINDLIAGLVQLGIQYVLNAALGQTLSAASTATGVAEAATLTAAFAPAAALSSLASFGANTLPALAGIAAVIALTQSFADGGMVRGAGGPRSDSIPARLSNGEFVVNAQSTARFRPQLEAMNSGQGFQAGGAVSSNGASGATTGSMGGGAGPGAGAPTIINILDPSLVEDAMATPSGERAIVNIIERNSSSVKLILRDT